MDIWVDDAKLAVGEEIAETITDVYANTCHKIDDRWKIMDIVDGGPPVPVQVDKPTVKAWMIPKTLDVRLERQRADSGTCCDTSSSGIGITSSDSSEGSWPEVGSLSSSDSQTGAWPQDTPSEA